MLMFGFVWEFLGVLNVKFLVDVWNVEISGTIGSIYTKLSIEGFGFLDLPATSSCGMT
jgi:hypothetical protein